ncbi:hypothetical protein COOONC_15350 [Cooperia oncophora]
MKSAKVNFGNLPEPMTEREYIIYEAVTMTLENYGIPIYMPYKREAMVRQRFLTQYPQMQHREEAQMGGGVEAIVGHDQLAANPLHQDIPPTFRGPFISRENEYRIAYDKHYTGGQNIHPHFLSNHYKELMFCYYDDDYAPDYYAQDFTITADTSMLAGRINHVEGKRPSVKVKAFESYAQYVERYMLVAMRGRQRCGRIVTIDDAIFSERMLPDFLEMTQQVGVTVGVRMNFVKALIAFYRFLEKHIDASMVWL